MLTRLRKLTPAAQQRLNFALDVAILVAASFVAASGDGAIHWKVALAMAVAAATAWTFASRVLGHYKVANGRTFLGDIALTIVLLAAVALPLTLLRFLVPHYAMTTEMTRFMVIMLPAILWVRMRSTGLGLWRTRPVDQLLIVGVGSLGRLTHRELRDAGKRQEVIGHLRFQDEQEGSRLQAPVLGSVKDIEKVLREHVVNEVYFASNGPQHREDVQTAIRSCERFGIPFAIPACGYRFARAKPAHEEAIPDGYVHYLSVRNKPIQRAIKRLIDIAVSFTALALLSPLLVGTAIAIKLTSRGGILFKQVRVGMHGRTFNMFKFRSMVVNAEELKSKLAALNEQSGPAFKMRRDPRITAIGRFIRKYSIDELPQLVNVLRGDMTLVGPRPPIPSEVAKYEAWQRRRLSVRPGLTCVWQVSGRNEISFKDWMYLDMQYIDHWSLQRDLELIAKTVPVVLTGRGAS